MSKLDASQTIRDAYVDELEAHRVIPLGVLVPEDFNSVDITYISSGPGTGEIGTVVYKLDGNSVATLTLSYDGSNRLINIVKT